MPFQPPLPPLLAPYLFLPELSLVILTSTLGASTNWLLLRFLYSALSPQKLSLLREDLGPTASPRVKATHVVFISWLNDFNFWKDGASRLGLDFTQYSRLTFIDALATPLGLIEGGLKEVETQLLAAVIKQKEQGQDVLVMLDGLDFLLATAGARVEEFLDMIGILRQVTSHFNPEERLMLTYLSIGSMRRALDTCGRRSSPACTEYAS